MAASEEFVIWFDSLRRKDGEKVGGKNSSLGEMVQTLKGHGINVPDGFRHHIQRLLALRRCQ